MKQIIYIIIHVSFDIILQIIALSASANKLSKIQERAEEYAALIMEELDPDNLGYIEVTLFNPISEFKEKNIVIIYQFESRNLIDDVPRTLLIKDLALLLFVIT